MKVDQDIADKLAGLKEAGLKVKSGSGPVNRIATKISETITNPEELVTVKFTCTRAFLESISYYSSAARYQRGGFIKLAVSLLMDAINAELPPEARRTHDGRGDDGEGGE